jgi:nucleotide-binding universal stress UspA family protein
MTPCKTIVAATDLSAPAHRAVARAFLLAAGRDAALELVHVIPQGAVDALRRLLGLGAEPVEQRILEQARDALRGLAETLGPAHGVAASTHLTTGTTLSAILDRADALDADLLVVGAHGEGYLGHLLLGTTAERLLRRTRRSVLMVRQTPHEAYRRILVPVDFSPWSAPALRLARAVAPDAELVLLHAFEAPFEAKLRFAGVAEEDIARYSAETGREALRLLHAVAEEAGLAAGDARFEVRHGEAPRVILSQEQELDCDLVILGKHGQGVMEELLLGSVTKHVLAEATCDVLVASAPGGPLKQAD